MKKVIIFLFILLSFVKSFSQDSTHAGSNTITVIYPNLGATRSLIIPRYTDTLASYEVPTLDTCGRIIYTNDVHGIWFRQCISTGKRWALITGGLSGNDTVYVDYPLGVRLDSTGHQIIFQRAANGLVAGGVVTGNGCWMTDVTSATIRLNFNQYITLPVTLTVDSSDATLNRIDRIVADSFGVVKILKGELSATPIAPTYNPAVYVSLTTIDIPAGASCLAVAVKTLYDENLGVPDEWDLTTTGTITADGDNADNPYHLTKAIFIPTYTDSSQLILTHTGFQDTVTSSSVSKAFYYLNVPLGGNQIFMQFWYNDTAVSANTLINPYINLLDTGQYQNVSILFSAFGFTSNIYNKVIFTFHGEDISGAGGLYLDWIQIQNGINNQTENSFVDSVKVVAGELFYYIKGIAYDGGAAGGGGSETWQQTLDNGSLLNKDNAVDGQQHEFGISNTSDYYIQAQNIGATIYSGISSDEASTTINAVNLNNNKQSTIQATEDDISFSIQQSLGNITTLSVPQNFGNFFIPVSVNGIPADNTGNITLSTGSGTVTSVAALTLGTTGTDLTSSVANPTTTPVITLNVPTASATKRGALSAADWIKFDSSIVQVYVTPDSLFQVFRHLDGRLDSFQYVGTAGTVTSFSSGDLSPLFTSNVATSTTTPALTFSLTNSAAHKFFGNFTGSTGAPSYSSPSLASADFANQGTTTTVLHGNASGNPSFGAVGLTTDVSGILPVVNGGTGTATPTITAGTNMTSVTGTWPNVTINAATQGGGGGGSGINFYNTDSLLSSNRTVNLNAHTVTFSGNAPTATTTFTNAFLVNPSLTAHAIGDTLVGFRAQGAYSKAGFDKVRSFSIFADSDIVVGGNLRIGHGYKQINTNFVWGSDAALDSSQGANNLAIGRQSFLKNVLGNNNIAIGSLAYQSGTGGSGNVFLGVQSAGTGVTTGSNNVGIGLQTFLNLTSGSTNVAVGRLALTAVLGGNDNTAVGDQAGSSISSGLRNTYLGSISGGSTTGSNNTGLGYSALDATNSSSQSTAVGSFALSNNTGASNIAIGYYSGQYNTSVTDQLFINNQDRGSYLKEQTASLLYYKFNATPFSQKGSINAKTGIFNWSPTAYLQVPAGTSVATTAPFKFTYTSLTTTAATGDGATATLTFATQTTPPFIVGSTIVVAGVTPSGYNGTFVVTACTITTVSWASVVTGAQTVAGTIVQGQVMGTPENGAMEYDGNRAFLTSNGTRQNMQQGLSGSFSQVGTATTVFTVTFGGTQPNTTYNVQITPTDALAAALFYVTNKTTTTFDVTYLAGLTGSVNFDWVLTQ